MSKTMTGGCQCGRVRYSVKVDSNEAYLCHCRMCQRATGGFAAAFVNVPRDAIAWQGMLDWYDSSPAAQRAFCSVCGSPIGFRFRGVGKMMDLTLGSFDDPSYFVPAGHAGVESMHEAWLDTSGLPRQRSGETQSVIDAWKAAGKEVPE